MCPAEFSPEEPRLRWLRRAPAGISVKGADAPRPPRLGVLSGTFNPPTRAHLALAEAALAALELAEVLFVLPEVLPHKDQLEASLEAREEMLLLAIARNPKFSAGVTSHGLFLDIHRAVAPHFPTDTRMYFLTGRDAAERILLRWPYANPQQAVAEMFARFELAVAGRGGGFQLPPGSPAALFAQRIHRLEMPSGTEDLSATLARQRAAREKSIDSVVPKEVGEYIAARQLYRQSKN